MGEKKGSLNFLNNLEEIILVIMFTSMVLVIFGQIIMRYIFNNSLSWSEELGKFLFVWMSWIGISIGAKRKEHIKITMFVDKCSSNSAMICNILSEIIVFVICLLTAYYGMKLVLSQAYVLFAGMGISMSWGYLSVVLGCIIMMLRNLVNIKISIDSWRKRGRI